VRSKEEGVTRAELFESLSVGLVVGGSIAIPHLRRAVARWEELETMSQE
jgi:alkylhydroperoxidase/carboxymuconolactone decarboxylase family protein YurZ